MGLLPDSTKLTETPTAAEPEARGHDTSVELRYRAGAMRTGSAELADETPIALEYNGVSHAVMLATPLDLDDFALGFSLSEGIVDAAGDLYSVEATACRDGITLAIEVSARAFAGLKERRRTLAGRTGCGICGTESLQQVLRPLPPLPPGLSLAPAALARANRALSGSQPLQSATGATHAAAWCDAGGAIVMVREDVGRHNALDKLIGALARGRFDPSAGFALITSRASVEMVQKAASARIAVLAAVSAPTSLAARVADACGLTLIGFARGADFSIYTHPGRVAGAAEPATITRVARE
jgi:FdhD protein